MYTRTPSGQKSSRSGFCEILIYIGSVKSKVMTSQVSRDPIRSGFKNVAKKSGKVNVTDLVKNRFPAIFGTYLTWIYQKNILKDFYVPVF